MMVKKKKKIKINKNIFIKLQLKHNYDNHKY